MPTWITGLMTGGFSFLSEWWKGKKEQAQKELEIKQAEKETTNNIRLKQATAQIENDTISIVQMQRSFKDEWFLILFSLPLIALFISPFLDLFLTFSDYKEGMLSQAAMQSLKNLDSAPDWYTYIITVMCMVSFGYRKGIDKLYSLFKNKK